MGGSLYGDYKSTGEFDGISWEVSNVRGSISQPVLGFRGLLSESTLAGWPSCFKFHRRG